MSVNLTIGAGLAAQLVVLDEVTYGVAPTLTSPATYEFKSESLKLKKNTVQGQGLHGGAGTLPLYDRAGRRVLATYEAAGSITMDLPANQLGELLQHMVGSFGQTLATPTEISTSGVYTQVHQPGSLQGHSFCVQKGVPATDGTVEPFTYVGCKIESWKLSCDVNQIAQLELTLDARNELAGAGNSDPLNGSVPTLATPGYTAGMELLHFREATLYTAAASTTADDLVALTSESALGQVTKAEVDHAVKLSKERIFLGNNGFKSEQLEDGYRKISGSFDIEFQSAEAMYNAFAADTTKSLELKFVGPVIGSSGSNTSLLSVIVPAIKLDGDSPTVGGPGVVNTNVAWTGLDDETNAQIQFLYQSTDSAL